MNTRLEKRDTYTLENLTGLAKKCDWFINGYELLKIKEGDPEIIFLTSYKGNSGIKYLVNDLLSYIKKGFILIIASDDYTFPSGNGDMRINLYRDCQDLIKILIDFPLLIHIFVENLDIQHPKMTPIPLGILESNVNIFEPQFYNLDCSKKNLCIICDRIRDGNDQWNDRKTAKLLAKTEWVDFVKSIDPEISHDNFILELKTAKFCLCIHGGGYDPCPKFFECILYGTIPIIQHSPLDEVFSKFPVIFIGELKKDVLSKAFLNDKYLELKEYYEGSKRNDILKLLTLEYWWNIIIDKAKNNSIIPIKNDNKWRTIAKEGEIIKVALGARIRYGNYNFNWIEKINDNENIIVCNIHFGKDPSPNIKKVLQIYS